VLLTVPGDILFYYCNARFIMTLARLFPFQFGRLLRKNNQAEDLGDLKSCEITTVLVNVQRPAFDELPLRKGDPKGSAWNLWGQDDELGTLNLITEDVTRAAATEIKVGKAISLKYEESIQHVLNCTVYM
jgi:hypothetical protein